MWRLPSNWGSSVNAAVLVSGSSSRICCVYCLFVSQIHSLGKIVYLFLSHCLAALRGHLEFTAKTITPFHCYERVDVRIPLVLFGRLCSLCLYLFSFSFSYFILFRQAWYRLIHFFYMFLILLTLKKGEEENVYYIIILFLLKCYLLKHPG